MLTVSVAILFMVTLSFFKVPIVASIVFASVLAGQIADFPLTETIVSFNKGIKNGAAIALNYACLGAFAAGLAKSGLPSWLCEYAANHTAIKDTQSPKYIVIIILLIAAICSQNLIPIHIAFIPIMVPALIILMNKVNLDRRVIACAISFGLVTPYMILPVGFGAVYIKEILFNNLAIQGVNTDQLSIFKAMWLPMLGMVTGLLIAIFCSYRKPRIYPAATKEHTLPKQHHKPCKKTIRVTLIATIAALGIQIATGSMIIGALIGFSIFTIGGVIHIKESDDVFISGLKMMASIGFIMISAQGFSQVLIDSGEIMPMAKSIAPIFQNNLPMGIFLMLLAGLFITLGIGSSFSTVPIIAALFIPLALEMQMTPLSILALIATAGALGDAGSPVSETTLGPSLGLNADGNHDHIKDTVIPTFLHFNIPLLLFGWAAVLMLNHDFMQ